MANTIKLKSSSVAGKAPTTADLQLRELAINTTDGKLFLKKSVSGTESVVEIGAGGSGTVTSVSGTAPISVATGTTTPAISIASASTSAAGAVQLTDSTNSSSTTTAATPASVKVANDAAAAAQSTANTGVTNAATAQTTANAAVVRAGDTMTGALGVTAGTAAAPSLFISGSTNTGLYSPGSGQLAISTNSTQRLTIDASGRLLVGQTSGTLPLEVTASTGAARVTSSAGTNATYFQANNTGGALNIGIDSSTGGSLFGAGGYTAGIWHSGAYPLTLGTNNTERLRITAAGLVGVGSSLPIHPLTVAGDIAVGGTGNVGLRFHSASPTAASLRWLLANDQGNGDLLRLYRYDSSGNFAASVLAVDSSNRVGIGVSAPGSNLDVRGSSTGTINIQGGSAYAQLTLTDGGSGANYIDSTNTNLSIRTNNSSWLRLGTNNTTAVHIDSSQRVGIGSNSPAQQFVVSNGGAAGLEVTPIGYNSGPGLLGFNRSTAAFTPLALDAAYQTFYINGSEKARLDSSGRLGVGNSSPDGRITVQRPTNNQGISGGLSFKGQDGTTQGGIGTDGVNTNNLQILAAQGIYFHTGNTDGTTNIRATLDSSGRLGIGTSNVVDQTDIAAGNYRGLTIKCGTTAHRPTLSFFNTADSLAAYIQASGNSLAFGSMATDYGGHSPRMTLTGTGLGIGVSSPGYPLSVSGNSGTDVAIVNGIGGAAYFGVAGNKPINFETNGSTKMFISAGGSVGIGTSPSELLHVSGGLVRLEDGANGSVIRFYKSSAQTAFISNRSFGFHDGNGLALQTSTADPIRFAINDSEAVRIDSSKRLLVGTSSASGSALLQVSGTISDTAGDLRSIPQNAKTSAYTLVAADNGKHISITTGGVTVPSSVFSVGQAVTIFNNSASNQTITQGGSVTLRQAGTANTGNRTLAQYGVATILCVASNTFVITGSGLT